MYHLALLVNCWSWRRFVVSVPSFFYRQTIFFSSTFSRLNTLFLTTTPVSDSASSRDNNPAAEDNVPLPDRFWILNEPGSFPEIAKDEPDDCPGEMRRRPYEFSLRFPRGGRLGLCASGSEERELWLRDLERATQFKVGKTFSDFLCAILEPRNPTLFLWPADFEAFKLWNGRLGS